jgi:glycerol-3-phosphate dehydrogenase (NAD(P)+)
MKNTKVCILGAGYMGTALAMLIAKNGYKVVMHTIEHDVAVQINKSHRNDRFLPGMKLQKSISSTENYAEALDGARFVIFAVPSRVVHKVTKEIAPMIGKNHILISTAKGLEPDLKITMTRLIQKNISPDLGNNIVALSGPSIASEIAEGKLTAVAIAAKEKKVLEETKKIFANEYFRVTMTDDMTGIQFGGFIKNTIAILGGVCDGLKEGTNFKAALMALGFDELSRLAAKMGASHSTLNGISGLGDLIDTSFSKNSRNRRLGELLASGKKLQSALDEIGQAVEGVESTRIAIDLAKKYKIRLPITEKIGDILFNRQSPRKALTDLFKHTNF